MMEDYCEHWVPNYLIAEHHIGSILIINHISNTGILSSVNASTCNYLNIKNNNRPISVFPTLIGILFYSPFYTIVAESDSLITKKTHPELFI